MGCIAFVSIIPSVRGFQAQDSKACALCLSRPTLKRSIVMCDQKLSAAEKTRRLLSETKPLVKFNKDAEYLEERTAVAYTSNNGKENAIDVWTVTAFLSILVPLLGFVVGVATGNIDVNPR